MPRGGARPGAGRKRRRPYLGIVQPDASAPASIRRAERLLSDALPDLMDVAISLARAGDRRMLIYCIDRVLGSPVRPIDLQATVRDLALSRNLDPDRVVSLYDAIRRRATS